MGKFEDQIKQYQQENQKRTGKKNYDDTYDASKIEPQPAADPAPAPSGDKATGNLPVDLTNAMERRKRALGQ